MDFFFSTLTFPSGWPFCSLLADDLRAKRACNMNKMNYFDRILKRELIPVKYDYFDYY